VSAWIATQEKANATVAPFNAFVSRDRQLFVFVVDETEGTVEQRAVQEGIEGLAKREILKGVKIGEKLVTDGKTQLVNGALTVGQNHSLNQKYTDESKHFPPKSSIAQFFFLKTIFAILLSLLMMVECGTLAR